MRYGVALATLLCAAGLTLCVGYCALGDDVVVAARLAPTPAPVTAPLPAPATDIAPAPSVPSAGAEQSSATDAPPVVDSNYKIHEEDIIRMDVWGEEELRNFQLTVTSDGKVNVPYIGEMQAEGLTQAELTRNIGAKFEEQQILVNPKIQLTILSLHRPTVKVLGEVNRPGDTAFKDGDRLLDAIAAAGSYREGAWLEKVTFTREGSNEPETVDVRKMLHGDLTQNYELKKGDRIYVPEENYENKFYVLGYVQRPGIYSLKERTTVLSAIGMAGGPQPRAAIRGTVIVRGDPAKPERVKCNISRLIDKADLSQDIVLQAGDVVMVPETSKPDWSQISTVLGTVLNLSYLRRYGLF